MKKIISMLIAVAAIGSVSCKNAVDETPFVGQNIAVILRSPTDTIGLQIANGILGASMQYTIFAEFFSVDSLTDYKGQIAILENLDPTQYIGVIIIPAADNEQLRNAVSTLNQFTSIVVAHAGLSGDLPILSFVGTDNVAAGESLAVEANKTLQPGDTIMVVQTNNESIIEARLFGFSERAESLGHPTYTTDISSRPYELDYVIEGLTQMYPGLKAIVTGTARSSTIVATTLRNINRGDIKVFAFDIPHSVVADISNGSITGTMASDTYSIGYKSVMSIIDDSLGITPFRTQYQPTMYIDLSNISSQKASTYINEI